MPGMVGIGNWDQSGTGSLSRDLTDALPSLTSIAKVGSVDDSSLSLSLLCCLSEENERRNTTQREMDY